MHILYDVFLMFINLRVHFLLSLDQYCTDIALIATSSDLHTKLLFFPLEVTYAIGLFQISLRPETGSSS